MLDEDRITPPIEVDANKLKGLLESDLDNAIELLNQSKYEKDQRMILVYENEIKDLENMISLIDPDQ